jgi:hypothetical protein
MTQIWTAKGGQLVRLGHSAGDSFVLGTTKPDASNTGLNVEGLTTADLTVVNGDLTINDAYLSAGGQLDRLWVKGFVVFTASSAVTVSNSLIQGRTFTAGSPPYEAIIHARNTSKPASVRINFTNCKITCIQPDVALSCASGERTGTFLRCDVSLGSDLLDYWNNPPDVQGCYLHDYSFWANDPRRTNDSQHPGWSHNDAVQNSASDGGFVYGNNIDMHAAVGVGDYNVLIGTPGFENATYGTGVILTPTAGNVTNMVIENNWFHGSQGGPVNLGYQTGGSYNTGNSMTVFGNRFGLDMHAGGPYSGEYNYVVVTWYNGMTSQDPAAVFYNNIYANDTTVPSQLRGTQCGTPWLVGSVNLYQVYYQSTTVPAS